MTTASKSVIGTIVNGYEIIDYISVDDMNDAPNTQAHMRSNGWDGIGLVKKPKGRIRYHANISIAQDQVKTLGQEF